MYSFKIALLQEILAKLAVVSKRFGLNQRFLDMTAISAV